MAEGQYRRRGAVPAKHAKRIVEAIVAWKAAQVERNLAITAALKAGGSIREVAVFANLSPTAVMNIGHANGWPTDRQRDMWREDGRSSEEFRAWLEGALTDIEAARAAEQEDDD